MTEVSKKRFGISIIGMLICVVLIVILVFSSLSLYNSVNSLTKDKSSLQSEINSLESEVHQKDTEISALQSELEKLERLKNVTNELNIPYDYYNGEWRGEWQPVVTFSGTDDMVTEPFRISSVYNLWRVNWTAYPRTEGSYLGISIYTISEPEYCIAALSASGEHLDYAWYIPWTSITATDFYIDIKCTDISTWSIIVEKLDTAY